jgi:hypothetical protein
VIARVWRGATRAADAEAYAAYVEQCLEGERALVLQRVDGDRAEIETIIFFDSLDAVHAFAGDDIARMVLSGGRPLSRRARSHGDALRRPGVHSAVEVDACVRTGAPEPAVVRACAERERLEQ